MIRIGTATDLGETFALLRALRGMTQRGLAAASGASQAQIALYEVGRVAPRPANAIAILGAGKTFGLSLPVNPTLNVVRIFRSVVPLEASDSAR